jgi:glycosyltransferase involved in cell wall biosynthesis
MKIGFDAKRLFFNNTGLGVYSRTLIQNLASNFPENEYILFAAKASKSPYFQLFQDLPKVGPKHVSILWRSFGISKSIEHEHCDIYHGLSHELPIGIARARVKKVVTIHDLIFLKYPSMYSWWDRKIYWQKWKYSCSVADKIIAVSEHTKADVIKYFNVPDDKISVIPPICNINFFQDTIKTEHDDNYLNLPEHYFLYVGAINERKNLLGITKALALIHPSERPHLIVVGSGSDYEKKVKYYVKQINLTPWISFYAHVPNENLTKLYRNAIALVYPSFYEGFGIPIVEALATRTPVITSKISSMPEAAGPGAIYVDPSSPESISDAMIKCLKDQELCASLGENGSRYIQKFSGKIVAQKLMQIYHTLTNTL